MQICKNSSTTVKRQKYIYLLKVVNFGFNLGTLPKLNKKQNINHFSIRYTDSECRLVPSENPIVEGNLNEEVVIPCKPTSKKWEVELIKENDKVN